MLTRSQKRNMRRTRVKICGRATNDALDTATRRVYQLRSKDRVCRLSDYLLEPGIFDSLGTIESTGSGCRSYTSQEDCPCPIHGCHVAKIILGYNPFGEGVKYAFLDGKQGGYTYV